MLISQKLEEMMVKYQDSRSNVSKYLLEQRLQLEHCTMQQIADQTFTSKATLVRVAKKLGYSGWNDFFKAYMDELKYKQSHFSEISHNYPFKRGDHTQEILDNICQLRMESTWQTARMMKLDVLEKSASLLVRSRRIALFGISINQLLLEIFRRKMLTIGKTTDIIHQADTALYASSLTQEDCAVMVSYSGNNEHRNPMNLLSRLKEAQVPVIAITSMGDNYLRQHADYVLTICSQERLYSKISTYSTEASIEYILDVLFSCCFALDYDRNLQYKINSSKSVEIHRYSDLQDVKET
ncbi:MAG: MurR/RpiR family transcriptional regulator [Brotaphodocola sp.]